MRDTACGKYWKNACGENRGQYGHAWARYAVGIVFVLTIVLPMRYSIRTQCPQVLSKAFKPPTLGRGIGAFKLAAQAGIIFDRIVFHGSGIS